MLVALAVEAFVVVLCFGIGSGLLTAGTATSRSATSTRREQALIGVVLFAAIVALLGFGLGLLIRNSPAAVADPASCGRWSPSRWSVRCSR